MPTTKPPYEKRIIKKDTFTNLSKPVHNSLAKQDESTFSDAKKDIDTSSKRLYVSLYPVHLMRRRRRHCDSVTIFLTCRLKSKLPETHPAHICMPLITNTWLYKWAPRKTALPLINTRGCEGRGKKDETPSREAWLSERCRRWLSRSSKPRKHRAML